jgi:hypothetical protein
MNPLGDNLVINSPIHVHIIFMCTNELGLSVEYVYIYICRHIHVYGLSINIINLINEWQTIKMGVSNNNVIQQ